MPPHSTPSPHDVSDEIPGDDDAYAFAVVQETRRSRALVPPHMRTSFTLRYVVALALVASLTVGIGWLSLRQIGVQATDATVVNVAGRQRMLTQRVALLAGLHDRAVEAGSADVRRYARLLERDATTLASSQRALLEGDASLGLPGQPSTEVAALNAAGAADAVQRHAQDALALLGAVDPQERVQLLRSIERRATGPLPAQLDRIVAAYERDALDRVDETADAERAVVAVMLVVLVLEGLLVFRPMSRRIRRETQRLRAAARRHREEAARHAFDVRLRDAIDLTDSEHDLVDVVGEAMDACEVAGATDLLVTDPEDGTSMLPVLPAGEHGCSVPDAEACPAVRRGRTLRFDQPVALGGCGHFRRDAARAGRDDLACTCVPMNFLGSRIGVLRAVATDGHVEPDETVRRMEEVARTGGAQLGMLRTFARTRAAADVDPLTGLLNRRGLDGAREAFVRTGQHHLVVAVDLDHFKLVNDVHGHAAGDRVLVATAEVLRRVCRPGDVVARTGGEEFVVVAPCGTDVLESRDQGAAIGERVRAALAELAQTDATACTASVGVAGPTLVDFDATLDRADAALYRAKQEGRDRVVVAGVEPSRPPASDGEPEPADHDAQPADARSGDGGRQ